MTDYERFGDYQPSDRGSAGLALTFLFIGLGLGAFSALLFAPRSGKQMRKNLRRRYEDARESLEDFGEHAGEVLERGGDWARSARKKVSPIAERMRR
ncbi:MAG: YtxH domain-containing protein [Candidatus Korobacteraceae bacterium]